ncbi:MAG: biotin--[acetyl-CoA-carboxylase] ligase [Candidatus Izemoplasmatales bacterium]
MNIIQLESVDSTNQYIKDHFKSLNHLDVVLTKIQTKGKGRHINQWFSNQDSLTFSILLKDNLEQKNLSLLPLLMAMVLHKVFSQYSEEVEIKWPNDIYVRNKKLSGILIESIYQNKLEAMIIGVGINLNNLDFPSDIIDQVTSLKQLTNRTYSHIDLLNQIIKIFDKNLDLLKEDKQAIIDYCNHYHLLNNQPITYKDKESIHQGKCIKINKDGNLLIDNNGELITLISGGVHKIRNK